MKINLILRETNGELNPNPIGSFDVRVDPLVGDDIEYNETVYTVVSRKYNFKKKDRGRLQDDEMDIIVK